MPRYIDADALKDVIQQHDYPLADRLNSVDNGMFTLGIFQAIDQMPTISPDEVRGVVHGTWVGIDDFPHESWECDRCGCVVENTDDPWNYFHYCPNCGARLLGGENDS